MQSFSSFWLAFTGIFGVFTNLGLNTLTAREVARDKSLASKYLGNCNYFYANEDKVIINA